VKVLVNRPRFRICESVVTVLPREELNSCGDITNPPVADDHHPRTLGQRERLPGGLLVPMLTGSEFVCYNLHTGQGQMLRVAVSLGVHGVHKTRNLVIQGRNG
jgi:hypothetical protein